MATTFETLEIRIRPAVADGYPVEISHAGREFPEGRLAYDIVPWVSSADADADGRRLFAKLVEDIVIREAWAEMRGSGSPTRIRVRVDPGAAALDEVPWELLYDPVQEAPLATMASFPFSRYPAGRWSRRGLVTARPIRMLIAIAAPRDLAAHGLNEIDATVEREWVTTALADAPDLALTFLDAPVTMGRLDDALAQGYHILHVVGHGRFNASTGRGALYLADEANHTHRVLNQDLAALLARRGRTLRLVFLASCQSATPDSQAGFGHLAHLVVAAGVPAVLAMRDRVPVALAQRFAHRFYQGLFGHGLVDQAANEARSDVISRGVSGNWDVVVLYSRLPGNRLLQLVDLSPAQQRDFAQVATIPEQVQTGLVAKLATSQTPDETLRMQRDVESMLTILDEAPEGDVDLDVAGHPLSRTDLLLSKAILIYTEAEQSLLELHQQSEDLIYNALREAQTVDWSSWRPPVVGPYRERMRQRMSLRASQLLQRALGPAAGEVDQERLRLVGDFVGHRILAEYDTNLAERRTVEALALFEEIAAEEPDNALVQLLIGELKLVLRPDDPSRGQRQLYRLIHRLSPPQNEEEQAITAKAQLLLATWQDEPDIDALQRARDDLRQADAPDLVHLIDDLLIGHFTNRAYDARLRLHHHFKEHAVKIAAQTNDGTYPYETATDIVLRPGSPQATLRDVIYDMMKESLRQRYPGLEDVYVAAFVNHLVSSYEIGTYQDLVEEAQGAIDAALAINPDHAYSLWEWAELLQITEPVASGRERDLLDKIETLLDPPDSQVARRTLALSLRRRATISQPVDRVRLARARALFLELDEPDEVSACDRLDQRAVAMAILNEARRSEAADRDRLAKAQAIFAELGEKHWQSVVDDLLLGPFDPVGPWAITVGSGEKTVEVRLTHAPDGTYRGQESGQGLFGPVTRELSGEWAYDAKSRTLHVKRRVNFLITTQFKITLTGWANGAYIGEGNNGVPVRFSRPTSAPE